MRFAVVVLACMLAAAYAQQDGKYVPDTGRYNQYNNRYNNQYNRYNNPYNRFNNQYDRYNQQNRYNQYKPFDYRNQNYTPYTPFKPFATSTAVPRPVAVTAAPPKVTVAPAVAPAVTSAPAVTVAPVIPFAPIVPVAPVAPVAPFVPGVTAARVASDNPSAETVRYGNEINPDGSYSYFFETNNGIAAQAQGEPRNFGGNPPVVPDVAQGAFSWYSPEGQLISINWVADENGYQPTGDAIPQPPPLPDQIARALAYVARNAPVPAVALAKASVESN